MKTVLRFLGASQGAAATEFAIILSLLTIPMMSVVDLGIYVYQSMQLQNAGQMAAQAAWSACTSGMTPITSSSKCSGAQTIMTSAAQTTSLGSAVTITSTTEGFYCVNSTGGLSLIGSTGTFGSPPATQSSCGTGTWLNGTTPSDYIAVTVSYTYTPLFGGISVASLLTTPITKTTWMRMG